MTAVVGGNVSGRWNSATIELSDNANGTVLADGVKLVHDTSNDTADEESKSFDYTYDANGNTLTRSHDLQDAEFVYDARDLVEQVTNTRMGKSSKVTTYGCTARGQLASMTKLSGAFT